MCFLLALKLAQYYNTLITTIRFRWHQNNKWVIKIDGFLIQTVGELDGDNFAYSPAA